MAGCGPRLAGYDVPYSTSAVCRIEGGIAGRLAIKRAPGEFADRFQTIGGIGLVAQFPAVLLRIGDVVAAAAPGIEQPCPLARGAVKQLGGGGEAVRAVLDRGARLCVRAARVRLLVARVLCARPLRHLRKADGGEDGRARERRHGGPADPPEHLRGVVGARNERKERPAGRPAVVRVTTSTSSATGRYSITTLNMKRSSCASGSG